MWWGGGTGGMVLLDPRGRQRWKECVVQPVNTLTQKGGEKKNFLHAAFPPSQLPPPTSSPALHSHLQMEEKRKGGEGD